MRLGVYGLAAMVWVGCVAVGWAADAGGAVPVRVGIFEKPPFAIKQSDGTWDGLAVNLWERIAAGMGREFEYVELGAGEALAETRAGRVDVLVGEVGTSSERERLVDFSQPYLAQAMGAAFEAATLFPHWGEYLRQVPVGGLGWILVVILVGMVGFSVIFWAAERRREGTHFENRPLPGIGSALWFAAVTMTTVGYGDKTPKTPIGRAMALGWMLIGIVIFSTLTATVASTIAIGSVNARVRTVDDLFRHRAGVLVGSLAGSVLKQSGKVPVEFATPEAGWAALKAGEIAAFVSDLATLRYLVNQVPGSTVRIINLQSAPTHFALATPERSPLLEDINVQLLDIVQQADWLTVERRWLGGEAGLP